MEDDDSDERDEDEIDGVDVNGEDDEGALLDEPELGSGTTVALGSETLVEPRQARSADGPATRGPRAKDEPPASWR